MGLKKKRRRDPDAPVFYVYALVDPRCGEQFYIGKGHGKRHAHHVMEWRWGYGYNKRKLKRIGEIIESGHEVGVRMLAEGLTEKEAYRVEQEKIAEARLGREITNLGSGVTNLVGGDKWSLEAAAELVQQQLRDYPSQQGFAQYIVQRYNRQPTTVERLEWLLELKRLAAMRVQVHASMRRRREPDNAQT